MNLELGSQFIHDVENSESEFSKFVKDSKLTITPCQWEEIPTMFDKNGPVTEYSRLEQFYGLLEPLFGHAAEIGTQGLPDKSIRDALKEVGWEPNGHLDNAFEFFALAYEIGGPLS